MSAAKKGLKWSITSQWWHYSLCNSNYDDSKDLICHTIILVMIMRDVTRGGEGSRLFGRRSTDLSGALRIFRTKLGDDILKSESFFSWCSQFFCLYLCQFLIRPGWRKILICKINLNLIIQKSKLKINRQDEKWYLSSLWMPTDVTTNSARLEISFGEVSTQNVIQL